LSRLSGRKLRAPAENKVGLYFTIIRCIFNSKIAISHFNFNEWKSTHLNFKMAAILVRGVLLTSSLRHLFYLNKLFKMRGSLDRGLYLKIWGCTQSTPFWGPGISCDFDEKVYFFVLITYAEFGFPTATR
jgi:hypothetical protein